MRIALTIPQRSLRAAYRLIDFPDKLGKAVARGLDDALEKGVGQALRKNFSGRGPFAPSMNRLGVGHQRRTKSGTYVGGRLINSFRRSPAVQRGNVITASVGSDVVYWAIHELGGTIARTVKSGSVRLRTTRSGKLIRGETGGAVFARKKHKYAREVFFTGGKSYTVNMPKRAPMMTGLRNAAPQMSKLLGDSIVRMWRTGK